MPFGPGEIPDRLKGKGIPAKYIRMFNHTWNSVYKATGSEQRAFKAAYSVMGKALRKAGYRKDDKGVWHKEETMQEGWLSVSQNTLDDGDFAWVSNAYRSASREQKEKMNKGEHRKLPYKIHGKVNARGWRAAWIAAANPGSARALKSYKGGPSREQVLAKLRRDKPKGITIDKDLSIHGEESGVLYASSQRLTFLEEVELEGEKEPGLKYKGVALIDNVLSENDRFYSAEFNDRCMENTNKFMEGGGTVTIFSRHGKAVGGFLQMPTGLPVGKVADPLYREGNEICYHGLIVPTTEGKDMMTLIRTEVMLANSIRADKWESVVRELDGKEVQDMVTAVLAGIDFTDNPGIEGAGVRRILEEAPVWEEEDMDWEEVTLEDLLENCKGLLDEYAATVVAAAQEQAQGKLEELTSAVATLTEEKGALVADTEKLSEAEDKLKELELKVKVAEAAHIGSIAQTVYEGLSEKVKKEEDIAEFLTEEKHKAMAVALAGIGDGEPKGKARIEDDEDDDEPLTEERKKILGLAA